MSNIDKQAVQTVADLKAGYTLGHADVAILNELARIALASLEAEAVGEFYHEARWGWYEISEGDSVPERARIPLYRVPPAPVSVPDELTREEYKRRFMEQEGFDDTYRGGWNACRAAMLQGAEPVTTDYKLPANTPCKDAPEHIWLQTAGVWPENGEFSELTWCSDNQHKDDTLYVRADVVSGNSPAIPDGLRLALSNAGIAAPESDEMLAATCEKYIQELVTWVKDRKPFQPAAPDFREIVNSSTNNCRENAETSTKCWCHTCRPVTFADSRFVVCPVCGNKRCPHANDHRNACTGSNEPGQEGSAYPAAPRQEV
ncbi:hypothetical protein [Enterobacter hormaechei]|uniref:hypothetical protein n=1 Tax=Enterobacter hormaechei TaxID=158836 RepID=UPI0002F8A364|nr:hypothetical protein [Enterobacter hormaechei]